MREPVVVRATADKFPAWVGTGVIARELEVWAYDGSWQIIPFQVDEVSLEAMDIKRFVLPGAPGRDCFPSDFAAPQLPPGVAGPCEFLYTLRGTGEPLRQFTPNDEIVFLAGSARRCDAPTWSWPGLDLGTVRYKIELQDVPQGGPETGCVYVYRRVAGTTPAVPDLVDYNTVGNGVPAPCRPIDAACGTITGQPADIDGDGAPDFPAYQMEFFGNWTIDTWMIGETCSAGSPCPAQDMVDLIKWRIESPGETERTWDLQDPDVGNCGAFRGYIDGAVRVIRDVQGAASGQGTRKLEFAYPGEVLQRVYLRVHPVAGPIYTFPDLLQSNVSSGSNALVYRKGFTSAAYDQVDGSQTANAQPGPEEWYQVSSGIGSFVILRGEDKLPDGIIGSTTGKYDDTTTKIWPHDPPAPPALEWDSESGDRAALVTRWAAVLDTQNGVCEDPRLDAVTPIFESVSFMLSAGSAASDAGEDEIKRRNRGVFSQCVVEEEKGSGPPGGPPPCIPHLQVTYNNDSGPIKSAFNGCPDARGFNLYRLVGAGVWRRIATVGPNETFHDVTAALNEERTYGASSLGPDCTESSLSSPVTVLHNDVVAPPPPTSVETTADPGWITVAWSPPGVGIGGYKVLVGSNSGGPYNQVHPGLLDRLATSHTFQAVGGNTYYVIMKALDVAGNESAPSAEVVVTVP